jgi:hypothetical protein
MKVRRKETQWSSMRHKSMGTFNHIHAKLAANLSTFSIKPNGKYRTQLLKPRENEHSRFILGHFLMQSKKLLFFSLFYNFIYFLDSSRLLLTLKSGMHSLRRTHDMLFLYRRNKLKN